MVDWLRINLPFVISTVFQQGINIGHVSGVGEEGTQTAEFSRDVIPHLCDTAFHTTSVFLMVTTRDKICNK